MTPRLLPLAAALLAGCILSDVAAAADAAAVQAQRDWAQMDRCARLAFEKFPDYTPESLAKRDESMRKCQRDSRLPPRQGYAPKG